MTKPALESRWRKLFDLALGALDTLPGGTVWSWGGGAALSQHLGHRVCDDIDIFLTDGALLGVLSPQSNAKVRAISEAWQEGEQTLSTTRLEGAIRFTVSPLLTHPGTAAWHYRGRSLRLETIHEILAKKLHRRRATALARDLFDLVVSA